MKIIIKKVIDFFYNVVDSVISIIKILLFSGFNPPIKNIKVDHKQECYIFGNGPSLKKDIEGKLNFYSKKKVIVVNDFVLSVLYEKLKPMFYVFADPAFWINNTTESIRSRRKLVLNEIAKKTSWKIYVFVPYSGFKSGIFQEAFKDNKDIEILYYNSRGIKGFTFLRHFLYKLNLSMPSPNNVLIAATFISLNMGFKTTNLLGADHSWHENLIINEKNQVCLIDSHFNDINKINSKPWLKASGETYKMHEILTALSKTFKGYHELKLYGDTIDASLINLSSHSCIDAFKRKSIN